MEDIIDTDCMLVKRVCKYFEIKHLSGYHDLYLKSHTILWQMFLKTLRKCV